MRDYPWTQSSRMILAVWNRRLIISSKMVIGESVFLYGQEIVSSPGGRRSAFAASMLRRNTVEGGRVGMSQRFDNEGGRETVRELFRHKKPPTVIIVSHIEMAAGVFDELEEMGLKIGKDISVIVWGRPDTKKTFLGQTKWKELDLDLISWSREEMGRVIIRILAARRVDPFIPPMRVEIPTNIIRGASVVNLNEQQ